MVFILLPFFVFSLPCPAKTDKQNPDLILQWEVSHPAGEHQISLVFKTNHVDLFTNISFWQDAFSPQLGHFTIPLDEKWQIERERLEVYRSLLINRPPLDVRQLVLREKLPASLVDVLQEKAHAPLIRLNGYEVKEGDSYFSILEDVFSLIWKNEWSCEGCVIYKAHRKGIKRILKTKNETINITVFSRKQLNCYSVHKKLLECTDTYGGPAGNGWGHFQIAF
ncbi:MAG: hypothetical protein OXB86_03750 [Bdellovibrionales bacterium]|nr:hypothetical protein [Bdellovibrionales bacterium]